MQSADLFSVETCHLGVQQGWWFFRVNQCLLEFGPAALKLNHLCVDLICSATFEDQVQQSIEFALYPLDLGASRLDRRRAFHPKTVHLACEFLAEFLEESRVH
ncbi:MULTISPECIES: hypothetical protein [unclassified Bradyrhizobium]|uniref:hypothetical protein n=1 Tax=unclassified Bradyrhizobium TaxID=2631580 RepID=UPI001FFB13A7|nr:hypothetical protein [Bradyrhizobium sp. 2]